MASIYLSAHSVGSNDAILKQRLIHVGNSFNKILIIGGIHGDEIAALGVSLALEKRLLLEAKTWNSQSEIILVPNSNPDGIRLRTRTNSKGVDINRNFPTLDWRFGRVGNRYFGGQYAGSETETDFLVSLIRSNGPSLIIILHSPLTCINYDGPAEEIAIRAARQLHLPIRKNIGYPTPGSLGTYAGREKGIPILTVEFPSNISGKTIDLYVEQLIGFLRMNCASLPQ